jgi:hypothetical protein
MTMITNSSSVPLRIHRCDTAYRFFVTKGIAKDDIRFLLLGGLLQDTLQVARIPQIIHKIVGGSSRVDLQACKLGTGRRFTTS